MTLWPICLGWQKKTTKCLSAKKEKIKIVFFQNCTDFAFCISCKIWLRLQNYYKNEKLVSYPTSCVFTIDIISIDQHWDWKIVQIQRKLLKQTNISVVILLTFMQIVIAVIGIRKFGQIVFFLIWYKKLYLYIFMIKVLKFIVLIVT